VEEAGVPGENHRPWASNWQTLSLAAASQVGHANVSSKINFKKKLDEEEYCYQKLHSQQYFNRSSILY
jgi:hypothetical protein